MEMNEKMEKRMKNAEYCLTVMTVKGVLLGPYYSNKEPVEIEDANELEIQISDNKVIYFNKSNLISWCLTHMHKPTDRGEKNVENS